MNDITPIQAKVLKFIQDEISSTEYPPTHREIANHFKWASSSPAKCHLLALEKKGFLKTAVRISRGIRLTEAGKAFEGSGVNPGGQVK